MKMNKTNNKMVAMLMVLVLALTLIGCGENKEPVTNGDVVENTEELVTIDTETTVDSNTEPTTETESKDIVDGKVPNSDKPAEPTVNPTEKPAEPSPEPTEKPQVTPEPTPILHVHEYTESITVQPTCAVAGEKKLTCSCGDVKTEAIPATGNHNWVEEMETVVIPSTGHVETSEVQVQVGTTRRTEYECAKCGARFDTAAGVVEHCKSYIPEGDKDHAGARTIAWDYDEPVYETQTVSEWKIDTPETTAIVSTGRFTCSTCGTTK